MIVDQYGKKVNKEIIYSDDPRYKGRSKTNQRGIQVYSPQQLLSQSGRDKDGKLLSFAGDQPYFYLTIQQRINIFKLCSPVLGLVTSRMNRISGLDFNIMTIKSEEDRIVYDLRDKKAIYDEYKNTDELKYAVVKSMIYNELKENLPELLPDLSNFNGALQRWKKQIKDVKQSKCEEIKNWVSQPNTGVTIDEYIKKYVFDLMIHGGQSTYKQKNDDNLVENFDTLPGGTVWRLKNPYFSGLDAYIQYVDGFEPQVFYSDEISYSEYIPTGGQGWGMIPLEALINKIAESMLFDRLMADQADGTKPPDKLVMITTRSPFGDVLNTEDLPIGEEEQERIENKVNEPVYGSVMTLSGYQATVLDLSRESTMELQNGRQKDIREEVALVFNSSALEANLSGGDNTSGRATSESQEEISQGRGIAPIAKMIQNTITKDILPFRYGFGYMLEFDKGKDEMYERDLDRKRLDNGEITPNELREEKERPVFDGEEYNNPIMVQQPVQEAKQQEAMVG